MCSSNLLDNRGGPPTPTVLVDKQFTEVNVILKSYTFLNSQRSCNNVVPLFHVGRRRPLISEIMNIHHDPRVIHCLIDPCVVLLLPGLAHPLCQNSLDSLHLRGTESSVSTTGMSGALQGPEPRPGRIMTLFIMFPEESWFLPTHLPESSSEKNPKIFFRSVFSRNMAEQHSNKHREEYCQYLQRSLM